MGDVTKNSSLKRNGGRMRLFDRSFYENVNKFNEDIIRLGYLIERSLFSRFFMVFIKRLVIQNGELTTKS